MSTDEPFDWWELEGFRDVDRLSADARKIYERILSLFNESAKLGEERFRALYAEAYARASSRDKQDQELIATVTASSRFAASNVMAAVAMFLAEQDQFRL